MQQARGEPREEDGSMKIATAHLTASELVQHARTIEAQIKKLDRRGSHITPNEEVRAHELKKLRLVVKDRIAGSS
jgi:hypothetical protein